MQNIATHMLGVKNIKLHLGHESAGFVEAVGAKVS